MGRGYNHNHQNLNHLYQRNLQLHYKSTYLPMLCSRPAIKEVAIPRLEDRSKPFSTDPLSPKIGCMGQVKRNNRIVGFPTTSSSTTTTTITRFLATPNPRPDQATSNNNNKNTGTFKYSKLKKIFSGKNLTTSTTRATTGTATSGSNPMSSFRSDSCRRRRRESGSGTLMVSSIEDMDPPLPVVRKMAVHKQVEDAGGSSNLWQRRRSGGGAQLKGLQLQQVHHQVNNRPPQLVPTTV